MAIVGDSRFRGTKRFEVLRRLGSGGAGVVYEAFDREQQTRVALKTLQAMHPNALLRFKQEFRALQDLRHPNLVRLGELFEEDGWWFFTMEYVPGGDFLEYVRMPGDVTDLEDGPTITTTIARVPGAPTPRNAPKPLRPGFDEQRLRSALAQLARGLVALHATGKIHRDVKPSNVLVTHGEISESTTSSSGRRDRVVILDFGLVLELDARDLQVTFGDEVVGTVGYMAPEQAAGEAVGPAADWYAVGVVLYRGLTGRLPFSGPAHEVLADKRSIEPPPPSAIAPGVPADLDALCLDLLRIDPRRRAGGAELLRRLRATGAKLDEPSSGSQPPPGRIAPFVGRQRELAHLADAFQASRRGVTTAVCIVGESGLGKSALARRFGEHVAATAGALVLTGRCHERESVRFKGVDGLIDALTRALGKLPSHEAAAIVPRRAALLTQIFPVLERVEAIAEAPAPLHDVVDPIELRSQAFGALRELLGRLAERRPVVLVLDDLQWVDADGVALLREVMRPPDAPALLLIATARNDPRGPELIRSIVPQPRPLVLEPLQRAEAEELAGLLLASAASIPGAAAAIADEAGGHPFFIDTLVRHNLSTGDTGQQRVRKLQLDEALWGRIERLEPEARDVVECVSIAGSPLAQDAVAAAVGVDFAELATRAWGLRLENLVRMSGVRRHDTIEPYHDRVRDAVTRHLTNETRRRWHERLARTLERALEGTGRADVNALALHWRGAGDGVRAAAYAKIAAQQASAALAFDRAAALYRMVLELVPDDAVQVREVRSRLGEALGNAGRGLEAAEQLLAAAEGAAPTIALDLRRQATEQLLISGHIDQGIATLRGVLEELGLSIPKTPRAALTSLLFRRAQIRLRGLGFHERDADQLPPEVLQRIDLCWAAARTLGMVDNVRGADFQTRHLLLALDAGEPYRVLRALTLEAGFSAAGGAVNHERTRRLVEMAEALGRRVTHPHAPAYVEGTEGLAAFLEGRWSAALERLNRTDEVLRDRCTGVTYERDSIQLYRMACLVYLGKLGELRVVLPRSQREAIERGDLYASTNLRTGLMTLARLADEEVDLARREANEAIAQWSSQGTHVPHFLDVQAQTQIDLYSGDALAALARVRARWVELERAMLLRVQYIRITMLSTWGRAAVAAAVVTGEARYLEEAATKARALEKEGVGWGLGTVHLIRGTIARIHDDAPAASRELRAAVAAFEAAEMGLHLSAARERLGRVLGGDEGQRMIDDALAAVRAQTIRDPARWVSMLAPFPG